MLSEIFIKKAVRDAIDKYAEGHSGKRGIAKSDVMEIILNMGGNADDVHLAMHEAVKQFGLSDHVE